MADTRQKQARRPVLAYLAGAVGLVLTLCLIGFVGWQAALRTGSQNPDIVVVATEVRPASSGFEVAFEARNRSAATAAAVDIEATLEIAGMEPATSRVAIDYIPGKSVARGGLLLPADPRKGRLTLRALGYSEP